MAKEKVFIYKTVKVSRSPVIILLVALVISLGLPLLGVKDSLYFLMDETILMEGTDFLYLLGRYLGLAAFLILLFQYLWTAKLRFLESLISYDGRVAIHRSLGFLGILILGLHPIFILGTYVVMGLPLTLDLPTAFGFLALLLLLLIAGSTFLGRIWRVRYESWKKLHWFTFPVLTLAFAHSLSLGSDMHGAFRIVWFVVWALHLLILVAKLTHKIRVWAATSRIASVRQEALNVTTIAFDKPVGRYRGGQFSFVSLKLDGKWDSFHPFSITSHPSEEHLTMTIKGMGDFTNRLNEVKVGDPAKIDLAYGAFTPQDYPDSRYVMVAGGVGITPIYGILKTLKEQGAPPKDRDNPPNVILIYSVHHETDILFRGDLESWFEKFSNWQLHIICSSQPDWPGLKGRLTPERILTICGENLRGTFFLCGPVGLIRSVRTFLKAHRVPRRNVKWEQFIFLP